MDHGQPEQLRLDKPVWRRKAWIDVLLLLALPWIVQLGYDAWLYLSMKTCIDPWVYTGYAVNFSHHYHLFPNAYYGTRLAAILPAAGVHHLLTPAAANLVLRLGLFYLSAGVLYLLLRELGGRRAALIGSLFLCGATPFLHSIGWDYPDGFANLYQLSLLLLTVAARRGRWGLSLAASGACAVAMVNCNLFLGSYLPLLAGWYLVLNRLHRRNSLLLSAACFAAGAVACYLLIGAVHARLGNVFWWHLPSTQLANNLTSQGNPWRKDWSEWAAKATWLALPVVTALGAAAMLLISLWRGTVRARPVPALCQLMLLLAVALMVFWEMRGQPVLLYWYYSSYLVPLTCLAAGMQGGRLAEALSPGKFAWLFAATFMVWLSPLAVFGHSPELRSLVPLGLLAVLLVGGAALIALLLCCWKRLLVPGYVLFMLALAMANGNDLHQRSRNKSAQLASVRYQDAYLAAIKGCKIIRAWENGGLIRMWYDLEERQDEAAGVQIGVVYRSVGFAYLWGYSIYNEEFPSLDIAANKTRITIDPHRHILLLSSRADALEKARQVLQTKGFGLKLLDTAEVHQAGLSYKIFRLQPIETRQMSGAPRPIIPARK